MSYDNIDLVLKVAGAGLSGAGSLLLAWRVKNVIKWVTYSIVAHEISINKILGMEDAQMENSPAIKGVPKHLLNYLDKSGFYLLIAGFLSLGIGMILNTVHFLLAK